MVESLLYGKIWVVGPGTMECFTPAFAEIEKKEMH